MYSTERDSVEIIAYAIDKAKEAGCTVVLNAAPAIELPEECLSKVDILVVNEVEAEFYCHEKSTQLKRQKQKLRKWQKNTIIMLFSHLEKMEQWLTKMEQSNLFRNESRCD